MESVRRAKGKEAFKRGLLQASNNQTVKKYWKKARTGIVLIPPKEAKRTNDRWKATMTLGLNFFFIPQFTIVTAPI
jgi:hypothetical protein